MANGLFDVIRALGHSSHVDSDLENCGIIEILFGEYEFEEHIDVFEFEPNLGGESVHD